MKVFFQELCLAKVDWDDELKRELLGKNGKDWYILKQLERHQSSEMLFHKKGRAPCEARVTWIL